MSREQIMDLTQAEDDVFDRAIDVQMLRLRRKVEASSRPRCSRPSVAPAIFWMPMCRFCAEPAQQPIAH
jgi:hypothetical protein